MQKAYQKGEGLGCCWLPIHNNIAPLSGQMSQKVFVLFKKKIWMGWEDSNLRMTESKSVDLPTCRHPNGMNGRARKLIDKPLMWQHFFDCGLWKSWQLRAIA